MQVLGKALSVSFVPVAALEAKLAAAGSSIVETDNCPVHQRAGWCVIRSCAAPAG